MIVKIASLLNLTILLFCIISVSKSQDLYWIYYDYIIDSCEKVINGGDITHTFAVDFGDGKIPNHLIIEVNSTDDNPAPILCFSSTDSSCTNKEIFVKNPFGKSASMWVKKEQFEKEYQELYINVKCVKLGCKYKIRISGYESAVFEQNAKKSFPNYFPLKKNILKSEENN